MTRPWTPWRTIFAFGLVSLTADMVYEGMRSVAGPFLGSLGASALVVGMVTGAGEAMALVLRLVTGPYADRSGEHWRLTFVGYAMTAVAVPLLAIAPFVGGAGLVVGSALILIERTGKAVRSPSKSALLAGMTETVGRGRGFGVHKALDQVGAFAGPLVVAAVAAWTGHLWAAFLVLAIPGMISIMLLALLRRRMPVVLEGADGVPPPGVAVGKQRLPLRFHLFSAGCALSTLGLMTFGVISYALVEQGTVRAAWVPVVYAGAMAVGAVAALGTGVIYDRVSGRILLALPFLVALVPVLAFRSSVAPALAGIGVWALATGVQDSTVKALVADLVPRQRLGSAYGTFAALLGVAALAGGTLAGALYEHHAGTLIAVVAAAQVAALGLVMAALRGRNAVPVG
ncbi:MFS transporter [Nocardioides daejeonensis]|uniref:MFS transporter n=1 Tax=Nocardioides daejeonensis TaxID=1046556 RepID=UPI000D748114|nr:MFS transporter [Nocardioides daejeonensis]